jgi:hypothetical protein
MIREFGAYALPGDASLVKAYSDGYELAWK